MKPQDINSKCSNKAAVSQIKIYKDTSLKSAKIRIELLPKNTFKVFQVCASSEIMWRLFPNSAINIIGKHKKETLKRKWLLTLNMNVHLYCMLLFFLHATNCINASSFYSKMYLSMTSKKIVWLYVWSTLICGKCFVFFSWLFHWFPLVDLLYNIEWDMNDDGFFSITKSSSWNWRHFVNGAAHKKDEHLKLSCDETHAWSLFSKVSSKAQQNDTS